MLADPTTMLDSPSLASEIDFELSMLSLSHFLGDSILQTRALRKIKDIVYSPSECYAWCILAHYAYYGERAELECFRQNLRFLVVASAQRNAEEWMKDEEPWFKWYIRAGGDVTKDFLEMIMDMRESEERRKRRG